MRRNGYRRFIFLCYDVLIYNNNSTFTYRPIMAHRRGLVCKVVCKPPKSLRPGYRRCQRVPDFLRSLRAHSRQHMRVNVHRDRDRRVAKALLRHLRMNATRQHVRRMGVPQIVKANSRFPPCGPLSPHRSECVGLRRLAVPHDIDEGVRCQGFAQLFKFGLLLRPMFAQFGDHQFR